MIQFIKTLDYETQPNKVNVYEYLSGLTTQKIDPLSISTNKLDPDASIILYSPIRRVSETILKKNNKTYYKINELKEILFDIKSLCAKSEWNKYKSVIVRERFINAFIHDELLISRKQIFNEIEKVLLFCKNKKDSDIAIISHSFRLKLIEAYIKTSGKIKENPELIKNYLFSEKKTYDFGTGFIVKVL